MAKYVGHRGGSIVFVGSDRPRDTDFEILEVSSSTTFYIPDSEILEKYEVRAGRLLPKPGYKSAPHARVAIISPWGIPCGIETYTKWLVEPMRKRVLDLHIFAEISPGLKDTKEVTYCWNSGQPLSHLISAVQKYDPDIIFVQHEYGYFPLARHWLSFMGAMCSYHVVTVLHSVYNHRDKTVVEAACPEIIVHTQGAKKILQEQKGVSGRIVVIPHGCTPAVPGKLFNLYGSRHTLIQFGFGFPYKGWENSIKVVAKLKEKYPDVFFTGLLSQRWATARDPMIAQLNALAKDLGVTENIGLVRGFQSDLALESYLRTNRVGIFPYIDNGIHTVYGCSGAARLAMSKDLPIVTSRVPLFEDLAQTVLRSHTVDGLAFYVSELFENPEPQLVKQRAFLETNSWANAADQYLSLL